MTQRRSSSFLSVKGPAILALLFALLSCAASESTLIASCGQVIKLEGEKTFEITNPVNQTSKLYQNGIDGCSYVIQNQNEQDAVLIEFVKFDLQEPNLECVDYLEVGQGSDIGANSKRRFCGSVIPEPIILQNTTVWINFHTDKTLTAEGFRLRVSTYKLLFNEMSGVIASPNLAEGGQSYLNNLDLNYKITTTPDSFISIRFESFDMENNQNNCYDYMVITPTIRKSSRFPRSEYVNTKLCREMPGELILDADEVLITLSTDENERRSGFVLSYSSIKHVYTEPRGTIEHNFTPRNVTYNIVAPKDKKIEVTVVDFEFKECSIDSSFSSLSAPSSSCAGSNDQLIFSNDFRDLNPKFAESLSQMISGQDQAWTYCACNRPVRTLVSLTNRLKITYQSSNNASRNSFILSYRFIQAQFEESTQLRIVQDQTRSFVGGLLVTINVPANHHLRLHGQSSICAFPKKNLFTKQIIGKDTTTGGKKPAHSLERTTEAMCSYLFDVSEPWTNMAAVGSHAHDWMATWYLNFESPDEAHNFEVNWDFVPNRILDKTDKSTIVLPLQKGFKFSEELFFNFQTSQDSIHYLLNLTAKLPAVEPKSDKTKPTAEEIRDSHFKLANLDRPSEFGKEKALNEVAFELADFFSEGKLLRLNSTNVLIKVMRNNRWLMNITYLIETQVGDCDFDQSLCNYTASPLIESTPQPFWFEEASKKPALLRHVQKYELLNLNHQSTDEKVKDFYLSIEQRSDDTGKEAVYSPVIRVQRNKTERSGSVSVNHKVFTVSFDYKTRLHENNDLDRMELFIVHERPDMRFKFKPKLNEKVIYYTSPETLNGSEEPVARASENCEVATFKALLKPNAVAPQSVAVGEPGFYWRHADNITVFSCFDFRLGFAAIFQASKNEKKAGIDNVQIGYTQDAMPCPENNCNGRGKCLRFVDQVGVNNEFCCCDQGFTGMNCEKKLSACDLVTKNSVTKKACQNGGICVDDPRDFDFKCNCAPGYTGKNCEIEINECRESSCDINEKCLDFIGGFKCSCTNCKSDETETCTNVCDRSNTQTCFTKSDKAVCICKSGFEGETCSEKTTTCKKNMCAEGSTCVATDGEETCICSTTKTGKYCEITLTFCDEFKDKCQNGGRCLSANADGSQVNCSCPLGFTGPLCETQVNNCEPNPCNGGECVNLPATYKCVCPKDKTGRDCERKLDDICYHNPCGENGDCIPLGPNDFRCGCRNGYRGDKCEIFGCDLNKFLAEECNANGTLKVVDFTGECKCKCKFGYSGDRCEEKKDLCESSTISCGTNGFCKEVEGEGRVKCECVKGFHGQFCEVRDNLCKDKCVHGTCDILADGGYKCSCIDGWSGENCDVHSRGCSLHKDCVAENTLYFNTTLKGCYCHCRKGFRGSRCEENIQDCLTQGHRCKNNSTCVDLVSSFKCKCEPGFGGTFCDQRLKACDLRPCKFGTCVEGGVCVCIEGYTGDACDIPEDRCSPNPCKNNGVCHNLKDSFYCECPYEYGQTRDCSIRIRNPCEASPCLNNGTCNVRSIMVRDRSVLTNAPRSDKPVYEFDKPTCNCLPGFYGEHCERSSMPCDSNPCKNNGYCINDGERYKCRCTGTFSGLNCENFYDVCSPLRCSEKHKCVEPQCSNKKCVEPQCLNRGECIQTPEGPKCICRNGFNGTRCEQKFDVCKTMSCLNGGTCIVIDNVPLCQCISSNFTGSRCEIVVSELQGVEKRFNAVSSGFHKQLSKSCNFLGNDTTIMSYVLTSLIIFAIIVLIMIIVYIYVYRQIKKIRSFHGKAVHPVPTEMNELTEKYV